MRLRLFMSILCMSVLMVTHVQGEEMVIEKGKTVSINYVLTVDGEQVDASPEGQPLQYVQGESQIIPGLENELSGLAVGDEKNVTVAAKDAYGEENPNAVIEVPKDQVPAEITPEVGMVLNMTAPDGRNMPARIQEIKSEVLVLNLNHPLAGKKLHFDVEVVAIQ